MKQQRLQYFDLLKGLAIYMVVMGHVLTACIREIDAAIVFKTIGLIHMPLFFFISGYFTYKDRVGHICFPDMHKRFLQLIVPMVVVSSIWIYYYPHSGLKSPFNSTWHGLWSDLWKNGYWFTLTLFIINAVYIVTVAVANRFTNVRYALVGTSIVVGVLLWIVQAFVPTAISNAIELPFVSKFYIVFMTGVICRAIPSFYNKVTSSSRCYTAALIIGILAAYYVFYPWDFPEMSHYVRDFGQIIVHLCLAVIGVHLACPWVKKIGEGNRWLKLWTLLGRKSLSIYLLHYFFLFPMGFMKQPMRDMGLDVVPTFVVAAIVAAAIIAVTLGVNYVIERSPLLALLLTGKIPPKTKVEMPHSQSC